MSGYWRISGLAGLACIFATLAGCGGGYTPPQGVVVRGTILKGGKPLQVPRQDVGLGSVAVKLVPIGQASGRREIESTLADKNGAFELRGAGAGIPPGKYRLAVAQQDQGYGSDLLQGAFSEANSPIEVDIPPDRLGRTHDLGTIDLDQAKK